MDWQGNNCTRGPECHCEDCEPEGKVLVGKNVLAITSLEIVYRPATKSIDSLVRVGRQRICEGKYD
jgi:hypothetical protein